MGPSRLSRGAALATPRSQRGKQALKPSALQAREVARASLSGPALSAGEAGAEAFRATSQGSSAGRGCLIAPAL